LCVSEKDVTRTHISVSSQASLAFRCLCRITKSDY